MNNTIGIDKQQQVQKWKVRGTEDAQIEHLASLLQTLLETALVVYTCIHVFGMSSLAVNMYTYI